MAKEAEIWRVGQVDRDGDTPIFEKDTEFTVNPGTLDTGKVSVTIPGVGTALQGTCVRGGQFNWVQAWCMHGEDRYVFCAFPRGAGLEGFVIRVKASLPPHQEPQDTETWTATKPPYGDPGKG